MMNIKYLIITLLFLGMPGSLYAENQDKLTCKGGICVEGSEMALTNEDVMALKKILREDELSDHKYEVIIIKSVIFERVYLLSAHKPNYYGIEIVLSKEGTKWRVLKKIKSIY